MIQEIEELPKTFNKFFVSFVENIKINEALLTFPFFDTKKCMSCYDKISKPP